MSVEFTTSTGSVTYEDTGSYDVAGKWLQGDDDSLEIGAPQYNIKTEPSPGVNGQITVTYGFRTLAITLKAVYVSSSENDVMSAWVTDMDAMGAAPTVCTAAGQVFNACILDAGSSRLSKIKSTGLPTGLFYATGTIKVDSKRLTT